MQSMPKAIILVGGPFAGKTTYAESYFGNFLRFDIDDGTMRGLKDAVETRQNVIMDGCNHTRLARAKLLRWFVNRGYYIECHFLTTSFRSAKSNCMAKKRRYSQGQSMTGYTMCGGRTVALADFKTNFEEPLLQEGFDTIRHVRFDYRPMVNNRKKALFFDLDGTVRFTSSSKYDWPTQIDDVHIFDDVHSVMQDYYDMGYLLIGVTNQSGVGRGQVPLCRMQSCILETVRKIRAPIAAVYYCPHRPEDGCGCRKPGNEMAYRARDEHGLDLAASIMVGNMPTDAGFAKNAGIGHYFDRTDFFPVNGEVMIGGKLMQHIPLIK